MNNPISFIESVKWRFAHTMPQVPHWYIVRDKLRSTKGPNETVDRTLFDGLAKHTRDYGRLGIWGSRHLHWYLHLPGHDWYYWTMGAPLSETTIVNRAKIETDNVRYLDVMDRVSPNDRELIERWAENTECPNCLRSDPFALQWAGEVLIGLFCAGCRVRFL